MGHNLLNDYGRMHRGPGRTGSRPPDRKVPVQRSTVRLSERGILSPSSLLFLNLVIVEIHPSPVIRGPWHGSRVTDHGAPVLSGLDLFPRRCMPEVKFIAAAASGQPASIRRKSYKSKVETLPREIHHFAVR